MKLKVVPLVSKHCLLESNSYSKRFYSILKTVKISHKHVPPYLPPLPFPAHLADLLVPLPAVLEPFGVQLGELEGAIEMVGMSLGEAEGTAVGMSVGEAEGTAEQSRRGKVRKPAVTVTGEVAKRLRMSWAFVASPDSMRRAAHPAACLWLRETNDGI